MRISTTCFISLSVLLVSVSANGQNLQPESRQEFGRVFGTSVPLTSPALNTTPAPNQSGLQRQSAEEFRRVFGQNVLSGSTALQTLSTPATINSADLCGVVKSTDNRKFLILWHLISLDLTALDHRAVIGNSPNTYHEQLGPARASRSLALIHQAMFEAANAFDRKYASTLAGWDSGPTGGASQDAAIVEAAYQISNWLYPGLNDLPADANDPSNVNAKFSLASYYVCSMAEISNDAQRSAGMNIGRSVAGRIIADRSRDGAERAEPIWNKDFIPRRVPGTPNYPLLQWQMDPVSALVTALGGYWGTVTPFALTSGFQFRIPEKDSPASLVEKLAGMYGKLPSYNAIRTGGIETRLDPSGKSLQPLPGSDGVFTAQFWAYDGTANLCAPARLYNQIAAKTLDLIDSNAANGYGAMDTKSITDVARFYSLVNSAMADAAIASWDSKYHFQFPRPVTYIRAVDDMAAAAAGKTVAPKWFPLGAQNTNSDQPYNLTPPFPSYPSGHAVFGGALFGMLRQFVKPTVSFKFLSDEFNGKNKDVFNYIRCSKPEDKLTDPKFCSERDLTLNCAERENADSRLFMGVHWVFDADDGIFMGNQVARQAYKRLMKPLDAQGQPFDPAAQPFAVRAVTGSQKRADLLCTGIDPTKLPAKWDDADPTIGFGPLTVQAVN